VYAFSSCSALGRTRKLLGLARPALVSLCSVALPQNKIMKPMQHWDADAELLATAAPKSDDEYLGWLRQEVQGCAAYDAHADLLDECCAVVGRWFVRFGEHNKPLWSRIRRGRRLASQLAELAPVLAHARETVAALSQHPASDCTARSPPARATASFGMPRGGSRGTST
jgi:hypothetical protein